MSIRTCIGPRALGARPPAAALAVWPAVLIALPVVALVIPNTMQYAVARGSALGPGQDIALIRAAGLALPALLVTVPLAAVAVRRVPARTVLAAGLACVLAGVMAVEVAEAVWQAGLARIAQGAGAGMILPAGLVLVWESRRETMTAVWAGALVAVLLMAMPPALLAVPGAQTPASDAWRDVIQPYPWLITAALATAVTAAVLPGRGGAAAPGLEATERSQLLLPLAPAAGFAVLAVVTSYGWRPEAQLLVAGLAFVTLLGVALIGGRAPGTASPYGAPVVMVAVGLLAFPVAAPLTGMISAIHGPHDVPLPPFAIGAAAAVLGALASTPLARRAPRGTVTGGLGLATVSLLAFIVVDGATPWWLLPLPVALLGGGLGLALAASLRGTGAGAALFGLTLCLPAVLTGQIAVSSLQSLGLRRLGLITTQQQLVDGLTSGYRIWLLAAGVAIVLLLGGIPRGTRGDGTGDGEPRDTGRLRAQQ